MKTETERILQLADAYADDQPGDRKWGKPRRDLEAAIDSLVADRDTLAAGMMVAQRNLGNTLSLVPEFNEPLAVASRLTPAVPAATAEPEYDLVEVHPDGRAWRYRPGEDIGECTSHFPGNWKPTVVYGRCRKDTGAVRFPSMPAALAWWRETHPEPAKPSPLAEKLEAMRDSVEVLRLAKDSSHPHRFLKIVVACEALARVVDELAKAKGAK